jgi:hypothetical protein
MFLRTEPRSGEIKHLAHPGSEPKSTPGKNARPLLPGSAVFAGSAARSDLGSGL